MNLEDILQNNTKNSITYNLRKYVMSSHLFKRKRIKEIDKNIELVIKSLGKYEINDFFILMYEYKELRKNFITKHDLICEKILKEESYHSYNIFLRYFSYMNLNQEDIIDLTSNYIGYFYKNIEIFIVKENSLNLNYKELYEMEKYLKNYYENNKEEVIKNFIIPIFKKHDENFCKEDLDEINVHMFVKIIEEIIEDEFMTFSDVTLLNIGTYCSVYRIGNKILKIGKIKKKFHVPNSEHLLQPFIRLELKNSAGDKIGQIELQQYVDTKNIRSAELYKLYANLRNQGIVWNDARKFNVGRLEKANYIYYQGKIINMDQKFNGFDKNNKIVLKKGDCVVIDIDYLYKEEEFNNEFLLCTSYIFSINILL